MTGAGNPLLDGALRYAALGLPVFPCAPAQKKPITQHGFHDATTDDATIRAWWCERPRANVAIPTGAVSGVIVIDVDPRNGGNGGLTELVARFGPLPETAVALTGGGGRHLFFQHPGGHVPCMHGELAVGVDVKGDGGYVVMPPSAHPNGRAYAWDSPSDEIHPAPCPTWLVKLIRQDGRGPPTEPAADAAGNPIPEGHRNSTLASLAGGMRRMGMGRDEILCALLATNGARCRPPLADSEVERIAASVARYEPDQVTVALVEQHYDQMYDQKAEPGEAPAGDDPGSVPDELLRVPGFIGELMDYCLATAPYPNPVMAFCGATAMQAFLAGRRVRDSGDNRTNIYLLGLAHSAAGKDWPRKVNTRIAHEIGLADCLGDRFASGEGIQDALFINPCMLFQTDEIDGMLQSINKSKDARHENVMGTLLTMYSAASSVFPMRRRAGAASPGVVDQPCLVIFGTAIPNHYYEALSERMLTNGFFARMVILESGPRHKGQEPRIADLPPRIVETARWWSNYRPGHGNLQDWHPVPAIVEQSDDALAVMVETREEAEAEYGRAEKSGDAVGTTVWGRVSEQVRKLALLHAISGNHLKPHIGVEAARWASSFVLHQTRRMLYMASSHVAENPFQAECLRFMKKLRDAPEQTMPHSLLLKRMKIGAKQFLELVETLVQRGDVEVLTQPRAGTPRRSYRLRRVKDNGGGET